MKPTIWTATITGTMLLAGAGTAQAKIIYETFTSTISSGYDNIGRFGAPNADLSGKAIEARYSIDLGAGGYLYHDRAVSGYRGGSLYHLPVIASVAISIANVTRSFAADRNLDFRFYGPLATARVDEAYAQSGPPPSLDLFVGDLTEAYVASRTVDFVPSNRFGAPINYVGDGEILVYDENGLIGLFADSRGNPVHVTVTSAPSLTAEPAALALLGLGAAVLAAARRRW